MQSTLQTTQQIRAAIAPVHDRIERTPLALALAAGTFTRADYLRLHAQLWHLHGRIEPCLEATPLVRAFYEPEQARGPVLAQDLAVLGVHDPAAPSPETALLLRWVDAHGADGPALLGSLYVLEGSRLGGRILAPAIARGLGVPPEPGNGLDYYLHRQDRVPRLWRRFLRRLDAQAFAEEELRGILDGAYALMEGFCRVYAAR